jgi:hypothetical protein
MSNVEMDKKINTMLVSVKAQREEVEKLEKSNPKNWVTNTAFKYGNATTLNLKLATKLDVIKATSDLLKEEAFYKQACEVLGEKLKEDFEFEHDGYTYSQWIKDFQKRLVDIDLKAKKVKLEKAEVALKSIMSEEQRRADAYEAILASLNDE